MAIKIIDKLEPAGSGFPVAEATDLAYNNERTVKQEIDSKADCGSVEELSSSFQTVKEKVDNIRSMTAEEVSNICR